MTSSKKITLVEAVREGMALNEAEWIKRTGS